MSETNEKKLVPKLRFPEFENSGEWNYLNGNKLFEPIVNKNHNSDLPILAITQEQGAIPRNMIDYHVSVTDKSVESYKVVEVGDFIISLRSFQGGIEYSNYKGLCSPAYIILRKKVDLENNFYRHYFKSVPFIRDLNKNLEGIRDGKMISYKQFSEILIPNPNPKEQQKIADCLSSLDEVITAESQKLKVLKEHKKGLLQNLFPQEGETVPKLRFKEFEDSGEWDAKTLGDVAEIITGNTPSTSETEYYGGDFMFVSPADIDDKRYVIETKTTLTELGFSKTRKIKSDSVLFVCIGSTIGKVAQNKFECATNQQINSLVPYKEYSSHFIYSLLEANSEKIASLAGRQAVPIINKSLFSSVLLLFPKKTEQEKIAETLSSLDNLINSQSQKVETLKLHKKGLLQGLFPKVRD
jgi:type I restriction enzyme S subunit